MDYLVNINGDILPREEAKISVFDHGFLYGDGIFETMRAYHGKVFRLDDHLDRLFSAAKSLQFKMIWSKDQLRKEVGKTIEVNGLSQAYVRLSISRGEGPIGIDPELCERPNLVIMTKDVPNMEKVWSQGLASSVLETRRNNVKALDPRIKSFNFLNNICAKLESKQRGIPEGIMLNNEGKIAEGTVSNIFWFKDNKLFTPSVEVGILPGITRMVVLQLAEELSIPHEEGDYEPEELATAEEVFFTNSSQEMVPVISIDMWNYSGGVPGPITSKLHQAYRLAISKECK